MALIASAGLAWGDVGSNPYQPIFERNVFALKDPPPPPTNAPGPVTPVVPQAKVSLRGIINIGGPRKALLEVTEQEAGKQAAVRKPILREGERDGSVEVISISFEKGTVLARIGTTETTLEFETQKSASAAPTGPTPPRGPGSIPPLPTPSVMAPLTTASSAEPNIIPRNPVGTPTDRSGIGVYGGVPNPVVSAGAISPPLPAYSGASYGGAGYNPGATISSGVGINPGLAAGTGYSSPNTVASGTGMDTSRTIRGSTDNNTGAGNNNPVAAWLNMSIKERAAANTKRPLPPTPPLPVSWGGDPQGGN